MLNPSFSKNIKADEENYILFGEAADFTVKQNSANHTDKEYRTQEIYGDELWEKIFSLGLKNFDWSDKNVLDICAGTGFLSYHLLRRVQPAALTLLDISEHEIGEARQLIGNLKSGANIKYLCGNALKSDIRNGTFDVIIGNSFLHHFYNLQEAIKEFGRILKPGGIFISLHEPTVASAAFESRNPKTAVSYIFKGERYIEAMRFSGPGISPGAGTDVWIFRPKDIARLFEAGGFGGVRVEKWHFARSIVMAVFGMHLNSDKKRLSLAEKFLLRCALGFDKLARKILADPFFASFAVLARKQLQSQ